MHIPTALFQLKIQAKDIRPSIYRTMIVPNTTTFFDLHVYIQDAFNLSAYHLFNFNISLLGDSRGKDIEAPYALESDPWKGPPTLANEAQLRTYLDEHRKRCTYWYDFGDDWRFTIELQKILPVDALPVGKVPHLLKTKGPNLMEDCGGNWGFADLLDIYGGLKQGKKPNQKILGELEVRGFEQVEDFTACMEGLHDIDWEDFSFSHPQEVLKETSKSWESS